MIPPNLARRPQGATLIEVLVTIGIVSILASLLLPSVQSAREAARRMGCGNNAKQVALAVLSYESTYRFLPPGGVMRGPWQSGLSGITWTICILPYLEEENLYNRYSPGLYNTHESNAFVRTSFVKSLSCPSDVNRWQTGQPESGPGAALNWATGSYRACSGYSDGKPRPGGGSWFDANNLLPLHWRGAMHHVGTGVLRQERVADILDGSSNTMLFGEYATPPCGPEQVCPRTTFWAYTYTSYNQSSVCSPCGSRTLLGSYGACNGRAGVGGVNACKRGWGGFHSTAFFTGRCDGSVHPVSKDVDMLALSAAATIAGHEIALPTHLE